MSAKLKLPFGMKEGKLLHVDQVERGLACGCTCPGCNATLVARKGEKKTHHFSHYKADECESAVETALHLAAKQVFADVKRIRIPAVYLKFPSYRESLLIAEEQEIQLDHVLLEYRVGKIVPDLLVYRKEVPLLIEIRVTHKVDKEKLKYIESLGISAIEIDLSQSDRNFTVEELGKTLVDGTASKKWLFNSRTRKYLAMFQESGERKRTLRRGMALHVDDCPMSVRKFKGKSYANAMDDCLYCPYIIEAGPNMYWIQCGGRHKIKTIAELRAHFSRK